MALFDEWKDLLLKWNRNNFPAGDPRLDALGAIHDRQGSNFRDRAMDDGSYYSGFIVRSSTIPETLYRIIKTGNQPVYLEDTYSEIDYTAVTDGEVELTTRVYIDSSNDNSWSYTGGISVRPGKPLNTELVNQSPQVVYVVGATVDNLTGDPDYTLSYTQLLIDTNGNRATVTGDKGGLLTGGRRLILPANSEVLVESITGGTPGNTVNIRTFVNFIEPGALD